MLVLSRKLGESLVVGEIEIKVTEIAGDRVKIGIEAPKSLKIMRKELCQTVESNIEAANAAAPKQELLTFLAKLENDAKEREH